MCAMLKSNTKLATRLLSDIASSEWLMELMKDMVVKEEDDQEARC